MKNRGGRANFVKRKEGKEGGRILVGKKGIARPTAKGTLILLTTR